MDEKPTRPDEDGGEGRASAEAPPRYRLLDHTGDLAVVVRAPDRRTLYRDALRALFDVIADLRSIEPRRRVPFDITGALDREDLLVRYLSEALYLHDAQDWLFCDAGIEALTDRSARGAFVGEPFDPARHRVRRQVKAVTYHHLLVSEDRDGWTARFVLDL